MRLFLTAFLFFCLQTGKSQLLFETVINTAGGSATPSAIHLEWNVGELTSVDLYSGGNIVVTAGLLQGDVPTSTGFLYLTLPTDAVSFYPNPVAQNLLGNFRFNRSGELYVRILGAGGQTIRHWKMEVRSGVVQRQFSVHDLAAGSYFTEVIFVPSTGLTQKGFYTILKL